MEVSDGYANNFLFPQAAAVPATPDALAKMRAAEKRAAKASSKAESAAKRAASVLEGQSLTAAVKTNEDGTLYASLSEKDVVKAAKEQGISLKPKQIRFNTPIKETGTHQVTAEFPGGYEAEFSVIVQSK